MGSDKWLTDLTWGSNIGWSCGTLINLCPQHNTLLSLKVKAHSVSRMSLLCSFWTRPPWESGVTSLALGSLSSPGTLDFPSQSSSFLDHCRGTPLCPLAWTGTFTSPVSLCCLWAESSIPSSS